MKATTGDKIAFASVLGILLLITVGWALALAVERRAEDLTRTVYSQPTPELGAALAASNTCNADDADGDVTLARGR